MGERTRAKTGISNRGLRLCDIKWAKATRCQSGMMGRAWGLVLEELVSCCSHESLEGCDLGQVISILGASVPSFTKWGKKHLNHYRSVMWVTGVQTSC